MKKSQEENSRVKNINSLVLISDTFLPLVDGVCNTVVNYQKVLIDKYNIFTPVITPKQKNFDYSSYKYPLYLLKSLSTEKMVGYRGGVPFSIKTIKLLKKNPPQLIHVHTPFAAMSYAIILRYIFKCPIVFTYHTKFDLELKGRIKNKASYKVAHQYMIDQIKCADAVWSVNESVKQDLIENGCKVKAKTMVNGTDMSDSLLSKEVIDKYTSKYFKNDGRLKLLFIGRHYWVKGFKVTLDALAKLKKRGIKFNFVSIGDGYDSDEIKKYSSSLGLTNDEVMFLGAKTNKEELKAFYTSADLFVLPSTYDCCPLVVIEAASNKTPSVLIENSDASSNKKDNVDCFLIENNGDSLFKLLVKLDSNRKLLSDVSIGAYKNIFISWEKAIDKALPEYHKVINEYNHRTKKVHHKFFVAAVLKVSAYLLNFLSIFVSSKAKN